MFGWFLIALFESKQFCGFFSFFLFFTFVILFVFDHDYMTICSLCTQMGSFSILWHGLPSAGYFGSLQL